MFSFLSNWNDYFSPLIFIQSNALKTMPLALQTMSGGAGVVARAGTVGAATQDGWFARGVDLFVCLGEDGRVVDSEEAGWEEGRVTRAR